VSDATDLSCRDMVELVTDYLDQTMPAADRVRFEEHLEACDGCSTYLDQMRTTIRIAGTLREDAIPGGQLDRLMLAFRGWHRG
jgi:predicted anti-sigma-YlaC factor YlaD